MPLLTRCLALCSLALVQILHHGLEILELVDREAALVLAGLLLVGVGKLLGEDLLEFAHEVSLLLRLDPLLKFYVLLARLSQRV